MELVHWQPFARFDKLGSMFGDFFDGNLGRSWDQVSQVHGYPAVDVLESKDSYLIYAELPGMKREDIIVEVKDGALVLSGEKKAERPAEGVELRHVERSGTRFARVFSLPETVRQDGIEASYRDGVLEIRVPKEEKAKPRQIEVSVH